MMNAAPQRGGEKTTRSQKNELPLGGSKKRSQKRSQKVNYHWAPPKIPKKLPLGGGGRSRDKSGDVARGDRHSGLRRWIF